MQLRRFTADSTPAALNAVREALGDEAIILANRKIGDQVEIIATGQMDDAQSLADVSVDSSHQEAQGHSASVTKTNGTANRTANLFAGANFDSKNGHSVLPSPEAGNATTIEELTAAIDRVEQSVEPIHLTQANATSESAQAAVVDHRRGNERPFRYSDVTDEDESNAENSSFGRAERYREQDSQKRLEADSAPIGSLSAAINDTVQRHNEKMSEIIEAQSAMINQYFKGLEVNLWGNTSPNRRLHLQKLLSLGIGAELAVQIVERVDPMLGIDDALRHSFALLKSTLPIGIDKTFSVPGVTICYGAPGAGKTTVLIKMAMQHVKQHGTDSIVIICADTRRIGAFEELQAYGRLLGVPTVHAHDSVELDSLLNAFTHKQLVLVDHTLPCETNAVDLPVRLDKPTTEDTVRHLMVLSATSQASSTHALLEEHCVKRSMQCVLTNLDNNARLGEMFNAVIRHHIPIAYWSDAASVQSRLQKADASILIATAVAMSRRLTQTPDDEWLLRLIQPSDELMSKPDFSSLNCEVTA